MESTIEKKLYEYLKLFWLRPENGLLCAFKSNCFADIEFEAPSVDISCADGLFMFIHLGGELGMDFDIFAATKAKEFSHDKFVDIFDHFDKDYSPTIINNPVTGFTYGTDWKQDLLDKAGCLNLYGDLLLHDNNRIPLPFQDGCLKTVYSNSIYWVNNVGQLAKDIHRVLKEDGLAVLEVMTPYFLDTLNQLEPLLSEEAINILDRKRRETMPASLSPEQWKDIFETSGFSVEDIRCVYPDRLLLDMWNIGLRPVGHLLVQMADAMSIEERCAIKTEWVDIFFKLFKPLLSLKETYSFDKAPYQCFILRK